MSSPMPPRTPTIPLLAKLPSGRFMRLDHVASAEWIGDATVPPARRVMQVAFANNSGIHLRLQGDDAAEVDYLLSTLAGIAPAPPEQPSIVVPKKEIVTA